MFYFASGLELVGKRTAVENAQLLLDSHIQYFGVYEEMRETSDEVKQQLNAYDSKGGKGNSKGGTSCFHMFFCLLRYPAQHPAVALLGSFGFAL